MLFKYKTAITQVLLNAFLYDIVDSFYKLTITIMQIRLIFFFYCKLNKDKLFKACFAFNKQFFSKLLN